MKEEDFCRYDPCKYDPAGHQSNIGCMAILLFLTFMMTCYNCVRIERLNTKIDQIEESSR